MQSIYSDPEEGMSSVTKSFPQACWPTQTKYQYEVHSAGLFLVALFFSSVIGLTEQGQQENLWRVTLSHAICSGWYRFNNGPAMKKNTEALRWRPDTL